ncbi:MAG: universal stress protein [Candidatus Acidiferrales bacterium]
MEQSGSQKVFKNILLLTDFSRPSEAALPFAAAIAQEYQARVFALHVLVHPSRVPSTPELKAASIEAEEEKAKVKMRRLESQLFGLSYKMIVSREISFWNAVRQTMTEHNIELVVVGTHGRSGADKLLMGSVAEEIFRRSTVPVLTIRPGVRSSALIGGRFHRVLFATDFTDASVAATPYVVSLARKQNARLVLLHVIQPAPQNGNEENRFELSADEAIRQLHETIPKEVGLDYPPEAAVEFGQAAERIVEAAKHHQADLIVLGVRDAKGHLSEVTHLERAIAHKIVAHAECPVLTVRSARHEASHLERTATYQVVCE